jgi:hypothetical protein
LPTPTTQEIEHTETELTATGRRKTKGGKNSHSLNLADYVQMFPTPQSRYFRSGQAERAERDGKQKNLNDYVKLWPTPRNNTGPSKDAKHLSLDAAVKLWPTPKASDAVMGMTARTSGRPIEKSTHLQAQVYLAEKKRWPTPTTPRPHDSENTAGKYMPGQRQKSLESAAAANGGQLNPTWVEWLMGYPLGWTELNASATPLSLSAPKRSCAFGPLTSGGSPHELYYLQALRRLPDMEK